MRIGLLCVILTLISIQMSFGQNSFHRNYPADNQKNLLPISALQVNGGNYVSLEMQIEMDDEGNGFADTIVITNFKPKGDINWSKALFVGSGFEGFSTAIGSIVQGANDSLYFSLVAQDTLKPNMILGSISAAGNLGYLKSFGTNLSKSESINISHLLTDFNNTIFNSYNAQRSNEQNIALSRKSYNGNTQWAKLLSTKDINSGIDLDETVIEMGVTEDSTILITGIVDSNNIAPFLLVVDTLGNPILSKKYTDVESLLSFPFSYSAKQLPDTSYILGGYLVEFLPPFQLFLRGFIIKTDKSGEVVWSKKVIFNNDDATFVKQLNVDRNGDIVAMGVNVDAVSEVGYHFAVKFDQGGNIIWKKKYPKAEAVLNFTGNLFNTMDGGYAFNTSILDDNLVQPSLVKLDIDGKTTCEEDIEEEIFFDNSFISDTLIWDLVEDVIIPTDISKTEFGFEYDVPVLELSVRPFCPNEPIDWTFSATTEGATNYKWSTGLEGPTADSLRVFEEGEYMVTVTIGEDVCYMLCDTVKLERYTEPAVSINLSLGNFCINGKQTLSIGYQPGHPQIKSIAWSTGETAGSIEIATPGNYSVTVIDQCDETATASIDVGPFPTKITAATIADNVAINCLDGAITGVLTAQGNSTGLGPEKYFWSNGETTKAISINDNATVNYIVTVIDGCGNPVTASKGFELKGPGITSATIQEDDSRKCAEGIVTLNAVTNPFSPRTKYLWSTGATTGNLITSTIGRYVVTVTDLCGNSATSAFDFDLKSGTPPNVGIELEGIGECKQFILKATSENDISKLGFSWSNGATSQSTSAIEQGTYGVTVTDLCGNKINAEKLVDDPKIGYKDIAYANIFFPEGAEKRQRAATDTLSDAEKLAVLYNRTFGPVPLAVYCLDEITNYEFFVYNRWGQKIFESNRVADEWDGTHKDEKAPTETYVWVVKYTIFGIEKVKKGSVTLLRP